MLLNYVMEGGKLIIDCSGNFNNPVFSVDKKDLFGIFVERGFVSEFPHIYYYDYFKNKEYAFSEFVSDGEVWYGANYTPLENTIDFIPQIKLDDKTVVAIQNYGKGQIFWIGMNLAWHAYTKESEPEYGLIQDIFNLTIGDN